MTPNLVYLILALIFIIPLGTFIGMQAFGASLWGQYYAKSFASLVINQAEPGDEFILDIHKATGIANLNGETDLNKTITLDNDASEVCAKLSPGKKTCYKYFNNVEVTEKSIRYGDPINLLRFKIIEKTVLEDPDQDYAKQNEILA